MLTEKTRLTAVDEVSKTAYYKCCFSGGCNGYMANDEKCVTCPEHSFLCERLKEYEDIGFFPSELALIIKLYDRLVVKNERLEKENARLKKLLCR